MKIHIKGGRLIDPKHGIDAPRDVYIAAGKIVGIGEAPKGYTANRTIDAGGLIVCPGSNSSSRGSSSSCGQALSA